MVKNSKQSWTVGQEVRVGFLKLTVIAPLESTGDGLPGAYILTNGTQLYSFIPHCGLNKISDEEAVELCEQSKQIAEARATRAARQAQRVISNASICAKLQAISGTPIGTPMGEHATYMGNDEEGFAHYQLDFEL